MEDAWMRDFLGIVVLILMDNLDFRKLQFRNEYFVDCRKLSHAEIFKLGYMKIQEKIILTEKENHNIIVRCGV